MGCGFSQHEAPQEQLTVSDVEFKNPSKNVGQSTIWVRKLNMSPPKKIASLELKFGDVESRMKADGLEEYLMKKQQEPSDKQRVVYFLYGRGFLYDGDAPVSKIRAPKAHDSNEGEREVRVQGITKIIENEKAMKRILLVITQESDKSTHDSMTVWAAAQSSVLRYGKLDGAWTIFGDNKFPFVHRVQMAGNCYFNAPATVLGYKAAFDNENRCTVAKSVNICKFVRHSFSDAELLDLVVNGNGGCSKRMLKALNPSARTVLVSAWLNSDTYSYVNKYMQKLGPGLVSQIRISQEFKRASMSHSGCGIHQFDICDETNICSCNMVHHAQCDASLKPSIDEIIKANGILVASVNTGVHSPCGKSDDSMPYLVQSFSAISSTSSSSKIVATWKFVENSGGFHAMVLIGYRLENVGGKEKCWYLLQNSWRCMPLLEVSPTFLAKHIDGGTLFQAATFLNHCDTLDPQQTGLILESTSLDGEDEVDYLDNDDYYDDEDVDVNVDLTCCDDIY